MGEVAYNDHINKLYTHIKKQKGGNKANIKKEVQRRRGLKF